MLNNCRVETPPEALSNNKTINANKAKVSVTGELY
jgi:hypothetical protein